VKKIRFGRHWRPTHHRSGWGYALDSLDCLHCAEGVFLDGFIEKKFAWGRDPGDKFNELKPYEEPWIGIFHNPPNIPGWFNLGHQAPRDILQMQSWRQSMQCCQGLFTLSTYLKEWLRPQVPVPVCSLLHPTETPKNRFSPRKYSYNKSKQVVQVGWWLRKFSSFYRLQLKRIGKILLNLGDPWAEAVQRKEVELIGDNVNLRSVEIQSFLCNDEYDELLSKNVVFLDLYDSSANNAIVECIARTTPILVNPLPAVIEYLGRDYPFYFETIEEAAYKAENEALVIAAHEYLKVCPTREKLTREYFLQTFVESEIYQRLHSPFSGTRDTLAPHGMPKQISSANAEPKSWDVTQHTAQEPLVQELSEEWDRALAGDGQARANWEIIEGGQWSWQEPAVCVTSSGSEWAAYQYSRCDPQVLRALRNFVVEVTVSGSAQAAGLSFGPYKDFLVELDPEMGRHRLQLKVDSVADAWDFRVDGQLADRRWWDSAVHTTADLVGGTLTLKARGVKDVRFQDLAIYTLLRSCELSVITEDTRMRLNDSRDSSLSVDGSISTRPTLFRAPPFTPELVNAIALITPHFSFQADDESRRNWERDQNGSCWAEYEVLESRLRQLERPINILELGPGLGRSVVFFTKHFSWDDSQFTLYEADGHQTDYGLLGHRHLGSFCGNRTLLRHCLQYNNIHNWKIVDARTHALRDLEGPFQLIYSFYAVGYHWALEHFMDDLLPLMDVGSLAVFTVPLGFGAFSILRGLSHEILQWEPVWPRGRRLSMLLIWG
jgi:hypothetical protein